MIHSLVVAAKFGYDTVPEIENVCTRHHISSISGTFYLGNSPDLTSTALKSQLLYQELITLVNCCRIISSPEHLIPNRISDPRARCPRCPSGAAWCSGLKQGFGTRHDVSGCWVHGIGNWKIMLLIGELRVHGFVAVCVSNVAGLDLRWWGLTADVCVQGRPRRM